MRPVLLLVVLSGTAGCIQQPVSKAAHSDEPTAEAPAADEPTPADPASTLMTPASAELLAQWSPEGLDAARTYWADMGSTAVMVVQDGFVIAEWGDVERPVSCHSVRKSFLSALYGAPVADGTIRLDATLEALDIDDAVAPSLSDAERQATVEQLLQSRSGVYHPAAHETTEMEESRPERESHPPGSHWFYNNWDFNALGTIYRNETGRDLFEAFEADVAIPIHMEHFSLEDTRYAYEAEISEHPAYTFQMSTRDRARFGLLYARAGDWDGTPVLSPDWIAQSTLPWSDAGSGVAYGYMWWISADGWHLGSQFDGVPYSARGWGGQYIVVVPERDLVIVHTVDLSADEDMREGTSFHALFALILDAQRT